MHFTLMVSVLFVAVAMAAPLMNKGIRAEELAAESPDVPQPVRCTS
jgi:hypothetical protein